MAYRRRRPVTQRDTAAGGQSVATRYEDGSVRMGNGRGAAYDPDGKTTPVGRPRRMKPKPAKIVPTPRVTMTPKRAKGGAVLGPAVRQSPGGKVTKLHDPAKKPQPTSRRPDNKPRYSEHSAAGSGRTPKYGPTTQRVNAEKQERLIPARAAYVRRHANRAKSKQY